MTAVQYCEWLLKHNWEESVTDRIRDVPQPDIFRESAEDLRRMNLDRDDAALLRDGGVTQIDPQSLAWQEERTVARVTVDLRTTGESGSHPGRERLWGYRNTSDSTDEYGLDPGESERYGGLTGETKRIMDSVRKGDQGFDLIFVREMNDLSAEVGGQVWRATVEIMLDTRAHQIDPTP